MTTSIDPATLATHPDPYPAYAALVADRPLGRDPATGVWVAAGAAAVATLLQDPACRVRPADEPVPAALRGGPAGDLFGRLIRMTDGPARRPVRASVAAWLDALAPDAHRVAVARLAPAFAGDPDRAFRLPAAALASRLGIADTALAGALAATSALARGFSPLATPDQAAAAHGAAETLAALLGDGDAIATANRAGLLLQAWEATAGLVGNAALALARDPVLLRRVVAHPGRLAELVAEVARHDAPVQSTRRFVAAPTRVAGQDLVPGDRILLLLAAANRDPAVNPDPDRLDLDRAPRWCATFGSGPHRCPGQAVARVLAEAVLAEALAADALPITQPVRYRASLNVRVPVLPGSAEA